MDPNTKILTKVEAAVGSAGRVFGYAASSFLVIAIGASVWTSKGQVPDLETLKGWGIGAAFSGGVAIVAFGKNLLAPRSQIVAGTNTAATVAGQTGTVPSKTS